MHEVTVEKTTALQFPELIESVKNGDEAVFSQNDLPAAKLVAVKADKAVPQLGSAKGLFTLADDFEVPLDDFEDYLQ